MWSGGGEGLPLDADDEDEQRLGGDVEGAVLLAQAGEADLLTFGIAVFFDVALGALEDDTTLLLVGLEYGVSLLLKRRSVAGSDSSGRFRPERWLNESDSIDPKV